MVECYFLDVAQGTCQIIYFGYGRAIVIDGGPSARVPLSFLDRYVTKIPALIVTHNDADHHRGATQILLQYHAAIEKLYFLEYRPLDEIGIFRLGKDYEAKGILKCRRLERHDHPQLFFDASSGVRLEVLYPELIPNSEARQAGDANRTSGVLALSCGTQRILIPGDATLPAWEYMHARVFGGNPVRSDVLAIPHHGGVIWLGQQPNESATDYARRVRDRLRWLYATAFPCRYAIISVGTSNPFEHPREWVIQAVRESGATVLCTQITDRCTTDLELVRRIGIRTLPVHSSSVTKPTFSQGTNRSRDVACAGTVLATITDTSISIERLTEHQGGVDQLNSKTHGKPRCRAHHPPTHPAATP